MNSLDLGMNKSRRSSRRPAAATGDSRIPPVLTSGRATRLSAVAPVRVTRGQPARATEIDGVTKKEKAEMHAPTAKRARCESPARSRHEPSGTPHGLGLRRPAAALE